MIDVLVPHDEGTDALAGLPGVRAVRYDAAAPDALHAAAAEAQVLVPPFLAGEAAVTIAGRLPRLRLVQLLTAGAEAWIGQLPDGVALSDCRGAHGGATAEWVVATLLSVYRHLPRFERARADERWEIGRASCRERV